MTRNVDKNLTIGIDSEEYNEVTKLIQIALSNIYQSPGLIQFSRLVFGWFQISGSVRKNFKSILVFPCKIQKLFRLTIYTHIYIYIYDEILRAPMF